MASGDIAATVPVEAPADLPDRVIRALLDNQTRVRRLFRRWLVVASLVLGTGVGYVAWNSHQQGATIDQVRSAQVANTRVSNHRASCDQTAYRDLAEDLKLIVKPGETPAEFFQQIKIPGSKC